MKREKKSNKFNSYFFSKKFSIFFSYSLLLFSNYLFLSNFFLQFFITIYTYMSYYFLKIFILVSINENVLILPSNVLFLVVEECIAPNAYMLITFIFFSLSFDLKLLFKIWIKSLLWFSFFNLIRILILMFIYIKFGIYWFDKVHLIFYEVLSGIVTGLIVIYYLRKEKIKGIYPIYSDVKYLIGSLKNPKN